MSESHASAAAASSGRYGGLQVSAIQVQVMTGMPAGGRPPGCGGGHCMAPWSWHWYRDLRSPCPLEPGDLQAFPGRRTPRWARVARNSPGGGKRPRLGPSGESGTASS